VHRTLGDRVVEEHDHRDDIVVGCPPLAHVGHGMAGHQVTDRVGHQFDPLGRDLQRHFRRLTLFLLLLKITAKTTKQSIIPPGFNLTKEQAANSTMTFQDSSSQLTNISGIKRHYLLLQTSFQFQVRFHSFPTFIHFVVITDLLDSSLLNQIYHLLAFFNERDKCVLGFSFQLLTAGVLLFQFELSPLSFCKL